MSQAELMQAVAMRSAGLGLQAISKAVKRHPTTISKHLSKIDKAANLDSLSNYRQELKLKSVETLRDALTRDGNKDFDLYKAANVGVQVMKGLGEFREEQQTGITITISPFPRGIEPEAIDLIPEPVAAAQLAESSGSGENLPECDGSSQKETV